MAECYQCHLPDVKCKLSTIIGKAPPYLILQLKRFENNYDPSKNSTKLYRNNREVSLSLSNRFPGKDGAPASIFLVKASLICSF